MVPGRAGWHAGGLFLIFFFLWRLARGAVHAPEIRLLALVFSSMCCFMRCGPAGVAYRCAAGRDGLFDPGFGCLVAASGKVGPALGGVVFGYHTMPCGLLLSFRHLISPNRQLRRSIYACSAAVWVGMIVAGVAFVTWRRKGPNSGAWPGRLRAGSASWLIPGFNPGRGAAAASPALVLIACPGAGLLSGSLILGVSVFRRHLSFGRPGHAPWCRVGRALHRGCRFRTQDSLGRHGARGEWARLTPGVSVAGPAWVVSAGTGDGGRRWRPICVAGHGLTPHYCLGPASPGPGCFPKSPAQVIYFRVPAAMPARCRRQNRRQPPWIRARGLWPRCTVFGRLHPYKRGAMAPEAADPDFLRLFFDDAGSSRDDASQGNAQWARGARTQSVGPGVVVLWWGLRRCPPPLACAVFGAGWIVAPRSAVEVVAGASAFVSRPVVARLRHVSFTEDCRAIPRIAACSLNVFASRRAAAWPYFGCDVRF